MPTPRLTSEVKAGIWKMFARHPLTEYLTQDFLPGDGSMDDAEAIQLLRAIQYVDGMFRPSGRAPLFSRSKRNDEASTVREG